MNRKKLERHGEFTKVYREKCGLTKGQVSKQYSTWHHLKERKDAPVCKLWRDSYAEFRSWANENGYDEKNGIVNLHRVSKKSGWKPGNVIIDSIPSSSSVILSNNGKTMSLCQWAKYLGMSKQALWARIHSCRWTVERALTEGVKPIAK